MSKENSVFEKVGVFSFVLTLLLVVTCHKSDKRMTSDATPQGTVDGGGGNAVCEKNGKQCSILDLVESKDREPFDFDLREFAEKEFNGNADAVIKNMTATVLYNGDPALKSVFKENTDFMIWYLNQVMMSNSQLHTSDQSLRFIGAEAFDLPSEQVNNLQFYYTNKEIPLLKDQGYLSIQNPDDIKQVALQDNADQVLIQKDYFSKLDFKNKYALKLHEAILFVMLRLNQDHLIQKGTSQIRQFVKLFLIYHFDKSLTGQLNVNSEKVAEAFQALEIPTIKAKYNLIAETSDSQKSTEKICILKRKTYADSEGRKYVSANYFFSRNGEDISNAYAMDIEFMMKIQVYLVKKGLCIFKPSSCQIKWFKGSSEEYSGYAIHRDGEALPEINKDMAYVQSIILPKYQLARICN